MPKFIPVSLKELLRIGKIDDGELVAILASIFPRSAQLSAKNIEYRTAADDWVLSLHYRDERVINATAGPAFTEAEVNRIKHALDESLDSSVAKVWRTPMLISGQIEGWYRYSNQFQISPAPPEAYRPSMLYAKHPWVLEFSFQDSPNNQVRSLRIERRTYELALILNLFLGRGVDVPTHRARKHWVYVADNDGPPGTIKCEYLSEGYFIPGLVVIVDGFSVSETSKMLQETPTDTHFCHRRTGTAVTVPSDLTYLCDLYGKLDNEDRKRFLRACHWLHVAGDVWPYSQSLNLTSLIIAVECLAQGSRDRRSDVDASTKMFLDFMLTYAPGRPSRTRLNNIYITRSLVSHGDRILSLDSPGMPGLSPIDTSDRESGTEALLYARGALINWLGSREEASVRLLTSDPCPIRKPAKPGTKSSVTIIIPPNAGAAT